jgi:hypothetical protein
MREMNSGELTVNLIKRALSRARLSILTVGVTYLFTVLLGIFMVNTGNDTAISYRDQIVTQARSSPIHISLERNDRLQAALLDFGGNLYSAISTTLSGLGVITAFPFIVYRGWVGGIVSIDSDHLSRFTELGEGFYYTTTLFLQLIPYTLSGGAGINIGLAIFKPKSYYLFEKWLGVPKEAIRDAIRIYAIVIPAFLFASIWEFFLR